MDFIRYYVFNVLDEKKSVCYDISINKETHKIDWKTRDLKKPQLGKSKTYR